MAQGLSQEMKEELDKLAETLVKGDAEERNLALSRLMNYEQAGKIPLRALLNLADHEDGSLSLYAISGLGRNGSADAVKKLVEMLERHKSGNPLFLQGIVDALGEAGEAGGTAALLGLLGIRVGWKGKLKGALSRKPAEPSEEESGMRSFLTLPVVRALERIGDPRAAELLGEYLEHEDYLVRWHALQLMVNARYTGFMPRIREMAQSDPSEVVRELADIAIGKLEALPPNMNN